MDPEEHRYLEFFKKLSILGDNGHFTAGVVNRALYCRVSSGSGCWFWGCYLLYLPTWIYKHCPFLPKDGHEKQIQFALERGIGGGISALATNSYHTPIELEMAPLFKVVSIGMRMVPCHPKDIYLYCIP